MYTLALARLQNACSLLLGFVEPRMRLQLTGRFPSHFDLKQAGVGWWARALLSTPDPEVALMIDERKLMASSSPSSSSVFVGAEERPKASGYGTIVASVHAPRVQVRRPKKTYIYQCHRESIIA